MSNNSIDQIEILNEKERQGKVLKAMIEYLEGWIEDNPEIRPSIFDSIKSNIAYVEVSFFDLRETDRHIDIVLEGSFIDGDFEHNFKVLQSSFDNIIFNQ